MNRNQGKTWDRPTGGQPASGMRARGGCEALLKALAQPLHPSKLTKLCISCVPSECSGRELPEVRALGKAVLSHGSFRSAWTATLLPPSPHSQPGHRCPGCGPSSPGSTELRFRFWFRTRLPPGPGLHATRPALRSGPAPRGSGQTASALLRPAGQPWGSARCYWLNVALFQLPLPHLTAGGRARDF